MDSPLAAIPYRLSTRWLAHDLTLLTDTPSTSDVAMARAREGGPHGLTVIADTQTRGRGRMGHTWHSPPGENLYLSVVLRLDLELPQVPPVTLAAGVAVWDAVNHFGVRASLKWPNDVLVERRDDAGHTRRRKVAGILTEMTTRGGRADAIVVGVGLNVNTQAFPPELATIATSLRLELAETLDRATVAAKLCGELERRFDTFAAGGLPEIVSAWRERSSLWGQRVRVHDGTSLVEGVARDLDGSGALLVERDGGQVVRILAGEVEL